MIAKSKDGGSTLSGMGRFIESIAQTFPGISVASEARGKARANQVMLDEVERMRRNLIQQGYDQSTVNGMCLHYVNECSKSNNLAECLTIAQSELSRDYDTGKIDHSWFLRWSDGASEQFDDEMRLIWGKVLSGELEHPGSFSKRTMSILSDMSGAEARSFRHLCGVCRKRRLDGRQPQMIYYPFIIPNELALEPQEADSLRALGLTTLSGSNGVMSAMSIKFSDKPTILKIGNCAYSVTSEHACSIEVVSDPLTSYGQELSTLCDIGTYDGFEQYVMGILEELGADVTRVEGQTE